MQPVELQAGRYTLYGLSIAGCYTSVAVPALDVLFDVGVALRESVRMNHVCLSHGHLDHVGALPALLGMRGLMGRLPPLCIHCPEEIAGELQTAIAAFEKIQHYPLPVQMQPMVPGDVHMLKKGVYVRAIATDHTVPSLGFIVGERVQKLREDLQHKSNEELRLMRLRGHVITEPVERPLLAYTGDSQPIIFEQSPELLRVPTLISECTFLDERKSLEKAHLGKHTHLFELLHYAPQFQNEALVFMHFSQLYREDEVPALLAQAWTGSVLPLPLVHAAPASVPAGDA